MKLFCAGTKRQHGVGKDSGNAYDMFNMLTLCQITPGKMGGMTVEGSGYEVVDLRIENEAVFRQFSQCKFPSVIEVDVEPRPFMGKYVTTIVGLSQQVKAA